MGHPLNFNVEITGVGSKIAINKGWGCHAFSVSYSHRQGDGCWQDIIPYYHHLVDIVHYILKLIKNVFKFKFETYV